MLLHIDEREHRVLLEVLGSSLQRLREIDTAGYEGMRQEREAVIVNLCERLLAQSPGASVDASGVRLASA
ncbi:MAG TPA: hypothetical protein VKV73_01105 [Chloroflexota bacterium]|nr:hypothetical protein [Chloroflexota bacterium]